MPFPYVSVSEFRDEYDPTHDDFNFADQSAYETYLGRILEAESERVEAPAYTGSEWRTDATVPGPVADAVSRLVRTRVDARLSETLSSETTAAGRQESYRVPREVRIDIQDDLADAGFGSGDHWSVSNC